MLKQFCGTKCRSSWPRRDIQPDRGQHHPAEEPQALQAGRTEEPTRGRCGPGPLLTGSLANFSWLVPVPTDRSQFLGTGSGNVNFQVKYVFFTYCRVRSPDRKPVKSSVTGQTGPNLTVSATLHSKHKNFLLDLKTWLINITNVY